MSGKKRWGCPYKGSKSRIAQEIIDCLPDASNLYDLFAGGCAISHCAMSSGRYRDIYINDLSWMPVEFFRNALLGKYKDRYEWVSREDYFRLKDTDPYIRYCWSFGNDGKSYIYGRELEPFKRACHIAIVDRDFKELKEYFPGFDYEALQAEDDRERRRIMVMRMIRAGLREIKAGKEHENNLTRQPQAMRSSTIVGEVGDEAEFRGHEFTRAGRANDIADTRSSRADNNLSLQNEMRVNGAYTVDACRYINGMEEQNRVNGIINYGNSAAADNAIYASNQEMSRIGRIDDCFKSGTEREMDEDMTAQIPSRYENRVNDIADGYGIMQAEQTDMQRVDKVNNIASRDNLKQAEQQEMQCSNGVNSISADHSDQSLIKEVETSNTNNLPTVSSYGANIHFSIGDYRKVEILPDSVIYCDIPYQGTSGYDDIDFDYASFFDWCAAQTVPVYVSSYNIDDPRFILVKEMGITRKFNAEKPKKIVERLYKVR